MAKQISGTVLDDTDSPIQNAKLTLINSMQNKVVNTTHTDSNGQYTFTNIPAEEEYITGSGVATHDKQLNELLDVYNVSVMAFIGDELPYWIADNNFDTYVGGLDLVAGESITIYGQPEEGFAQTTDIFKAALSETSLDEWIVSDPNNRFTWNGTQLTFTNASRQENCYLAYDNPDIAGKDFTMMFDMKWTSCSGGTYDTFDTYPGVTEVLGGASYNGTGTFIKTRLKPPMNDSDTSILHLDGINSNVFNLTTGVEYNVIMSYSHENKNANIYVTDPDSNVIINETIANPDIDDSTLRYIYAFATRNTPYPGTASGWIDNFIVYIPDNNVSSTITDMGGYFKITITNNGTTNLLNHTIKLDPTELNITSGSQTWNFSQTMGETSTLTITVEGDSESQIIGPDETIFSLYPSAAIDSVGFDCTDTASTYSYNIKLSPPYHILCEYRNENGYYNTISKPFVIPVEGGT